MTSSQRASRPPHSSSSSRGRSIVDRDALTVSMAIAPGVFARNRLFAFFKDPEVKRAKARAAVLRGIARQLCGAYGDVEGLVIERQGRNCSLRYRIVRVRLERTIELTDIEAACVAYIASKSGVTVLKLSAEDRAMLDATLRRLTGE
jgi:hypothetical protein